MKKILFLVESLSGGGAEKVLFTLIKNLNREKYNITVYSIVRTGIYVRNIEQYCNIKYSLKDYTEYSKLGKFYFRIKNKLIYKLPSKLIYKWLIKDRYDVEIAFLEGFCTKLVASSNNKNSKKIAWIHIDMIARDYADKYYKNLEEHRKIYSLFHSVVCVSYQVEEQYKRKFKLNNSLVIYNPIEKKELEFFRTKYNIKNKIIFYAIGRLEYQKGFDRLIKVFSEIKDNYDFELHILGTGSLRKELFDEIAERDIKEKVFLDGFKENPYMDLSKAHVLICSSRAEGFSLVIAEAMCLGIPILTTSCTGPRELVDNGRFGYLVDNSKEGLKKGIVDILQNPQVLLNYHNLSKERANLFNMEETMKKVVRVFDE